MSSAGESARQQHEDLMRQQEEGRQQHMAALPQNIAAIEEAVYSLVANEQGPFDPSDLAKHRFHLACATAGYGDYPIVAQLRTSETPGQADKVSVIDLAYQRRAAWVVGARALTDVAYRHPLGRLNSTESDQLAARASYAPQFLRSVKDLLATSVIFDPDEYVLMEVTSMPLTKGHDHNHAPSVHGILTTAEVGRKLEATRYFGVIYLPEDQLDQYRAPISLYTADQKA